MRSIVLKKRKIIRAQCDLMDFLCRPFSQRLSFGRHLPAFTQQPRIIRLIAAICVHRPPFHLARRAAPFQRPTKKEGLAVNRSFDFWADP